MVLDFHPTTRRDIDNGNFPFTHDCILKVEYIQGSPLRFQYFTCWSIDSGKISDLLCKLSVVKQVNFVLVDELPDVW